MDDDQKDQMIVFMDQHLNGLINEFDSEKMMVPDYPQLYTSIGSSKLVINALPLSKLRTIVPVTISLPSSNTYQLQLDEVNLDNVTLTLEDRQENIFQDLSINTCYTFYGTNGLIDDRFFLHINSSFGNTAATSNAENDSSLFEPLITQYGLSGELLIELKEPLPSACHISILDMNGKLVYFSALNEPKTQLHLSEGKGIYYIAIDNSHTVFRKKIAIL
jgi:hypothetical protein